jgi:hypothetical protein
MAATRDHPRRAGAAGIRRGAAAVADRRMECVTLGCPARTIGGSRAGRKSVAFEL